MALFKIEKGKSENLTANRKTTKEGYCYFTTDDGKFYIDIKDSDDVATNRICLNANKADKDSEGHIIKDTYATKEDAVGSVALSNNSTVTVTKVGGSNNSFTIKDMTAPTDNSAGTHGLVPAAAAKQQDYLLKGDGTWMAPYSTFKKGNNNGLVPTPSSSATAAQYLNAEGKWTIPPNATYSNMIGATASAAGKAGLVPAPATGVTSKYLRSDGTWATPPNTTYNDMTGASTDKDGVHGLVPAPSAGTDTRYLRSDGKWVVPPDTNTTYSNFVGATANTDGKTGLVPAPTKNTNTTHYLRADGTWVEPPNTTYDVFKKDGSTNGLVPAPASSLTTSYYLNANGQWTIPPDNNTQYSNFTGAKNGNAGASGLVPAPGANTENSHYLKADGTWATPHDTKYNDFTGATASAAGVRGLVPAPAQNAALSYLKSTGNWDSALTVLSATDDNKLVTNKGIRDGITNATNGLANGITQDGNALNSFKVSFKSGSDKTITINNVAHATSADSATTATSADKATKLTNARKIGAASFNGEKDITFKDIGFVAYKNYYGINWDGTSDGASEDWYLRPPQSNKNTPTSKNSGFLPIVEGSLGNGHSSLGKSDWYFKDSYVDNSYVQKVNFDNGSASIQYDTTNKCINFVFS